MTAKKTREPEIKNNGNGDGHANLQTTLELLLQNQQELNDRLSDIEETKHSEAGEGAALVKLANMYFNTDDKHITELSFISPLAARPFAEAMALDAMTTEEVRSGKISLNKLLILNYLRLQRSVHGRLIGIGTSAMQEQISAATSKEEEDMDTFQAGKE